MAGTTSPWYFFLSLGTGAPTAAFGCFALALFGTCQSPKNLIQRIPPAPADPHLPAVRQDLFAGADRGVALVAHQHEIGEMNFCLFLDNAARLLRSPRPAVPLHQVYPLYNGAVLVRQHPEHFAGLSPL